MSQMEYAAIWEYLKYGWGAYKIYNLVIIVLGVIAFHLLSRRLKELKEITDEFEEKFRKRTDLLLSRVGATHASSSADHDAVSGAIDEQAANADPMEQRLEIDEQEKSQDDRWTSIKAIWDSTKADLNAQLDRALTETKDGRKRRPYERLDGRSFENVILALYDGDWIGERAAKVALDMNALFNSYRNQRLPISDEDLQQFGQLKGDWERLKENGYREVGIPVKIEPIPRPPMAKASTDLGTFRHEFWTFYSTKYPNGSSPSYASSRWEVSGEFVVAQYISRRGVGIFIRGPRGESPTQTANRLKPYVVRLERRLGVPYNNERYAFLAFLPADADDRRNWGEMVEWLKGKTDEYKAAISAVTKEG